MIPGMRGTITFALVWALLFCADSALADKVFLKDGRVLDGEAAEKGDEVEIKFPSGTAYYPKSMVLRIEDDIPLPDEFKRRRAKIKDSDTKGLVELAEWCRLNGLDEQKTAALRDAVKAEPDHPVARAMLGEVKFDGVWMPEQDAFKKQGLVYYYGKWVTSEEKELREALKESARLDEEYRQRIRAVIAKLGSTEPKEVADARLTLMSVPTEHKAKAFVEALSSKNESIRRAALEEFDGAPNDIAAEALAHVAVADSNQVFREKAVSVIGRLSGKVVPGRLFLMYLMESDYDVRVRAEKAIEVFPCNEAVTPLLSLLEVTVPQVGTEISFYETGMEGAVKFYGLSVGAQVDEKTRIRVNNMRIEEQRCVLSALKVVTGLNFGTDVIRWRQWMEVAAGARK